MKVYCSGREKVKTFYPVSPCTEPTVQHEETPQPPPLKPRDGRRGEQAEDEPAEQENEDMTFFTSPEAHDGHLASFSSEFIF